MLLAWMFGVFSFTRACGSLSLAFTLAATLAIVMALWRHEQAGRGSLNFWDEALTFNGAALFTHMLQRLLS